MSIKTSLSDPLNSRSNLQTFGNRPAVAQLGENLHRAFYLDGSIGGLINRERQVRQLDQDPGGEMLVAQFLVVRERTLEERSRLRSMPGLEFGGAEVELMT